MDLKSLACILLIFLFLPISLSTPESPSNSTSSHPKQASVLHGLGHHIATKQHDTKHSFMDTTDAQALTEDGDGRLNSYVTKGGGHGGTGGSGGGGGGGANSASHHTPASRKNRASYLSPPSLFVSSVLPPIMIFGFICFSL